MNVQISEDEFRLFRDLIHRACGLYFSDSKRAFLSSRIGKRIAEKSMGSFYRYYRYLREEGTEHEEELLRLLDTLTINETSFFRNRPQFELLEQVVLPSLVERKRRLHDHRLRVWSAGCSTGEEPYSIAISALEALAVPTAWDLRVYASDLSLTALEKAHRGVYPETKLGDVDPGRRRRYFEREGEVLRIREDVRRVVIYDFHNLKHENGLKELDIVFCRNVLIYFDPEEQRQVVEKLVGALSPGGYLFLGHSESVSRGAPDLKFVHHGRGTAYQKLEAT